MARVVHFRSTLTDEAQSVPRGPKPPMRLYVLMIAVILTSAPSAAQQGTSPSRASAVQDGPAFDLPVSLERIRELLARAPAKPLLRGLDRQPNFRVRIEERRFIEDILDSLQIPKSPAPPGGLYGFEHQRQVWNSVDRPLMQPYAAFNQRELAQVAATAVLNAILAKYLVEGVRDLNHALKERAAREEVRRAVADYCAAHPEGETFEICRMVR